MIRRKAQALSEKLPIYFILSEKEQLTCHLKKLPYSAASVHWAVFSIQEVNKVIPLLLRNISCLLTKCWSCYGTEHSF